MSSQLPAYAIFLFACVFMVIAIAYPWLNRWLGRAQASPGERLLAFFLGLALLGLWGIWLLATE